MSPRVGVKDRGLWLKCLLFSLGDLSLLPPDRMAIARIKVAAHAGMPFARSTMKVPAGEGSRKLAIGFEGQCQTKIHEPLIGSA